MINSHFQPSLESNPQLVVSKLAWSNLTSLDEVAIHYMELVGVLAGGQNEAVQLVMLQ